MGEKNTDYEQRLFWHPHGIETIRSQNSDIIKEWAKLNEKYESAKKALNGRNPSKNEERDLNNLESAINKITLELLAKNIIVESDGHAVVENGEYATPYKGKFAMARDAKVYLEEIAALNPTKKYTIQEIKPRTLKSKPAYL